MGEQLRGGENIFGVSHGVDDLFRNFLIMADQAAAHFTLPVNHDWSKADEVILRIHRHLKVNLYDPTGRAFPDATR